MLTKRIFVAGTTSVLFMGCSLILKWDETRPPAGDASGGMIGSNGGSISDATAGGTASWAGGAGGTGGAGATGGTGGNAGCGAGLHDGGDGICISSWSCSSGYHNAGDGTCVINAACPVDQLTNSAGNCVPMAGVEWAPHGDYRNWNAVASSADGTKLVAAELSGFIYTSTDSGATWTPRDAERAWTSVASSADGSRLVATAYYYIYTSSNSGVTWTQGQLQMGWQSSAISANGALMVVGPQGPISRVCGFRYDLERSEHRVGELVFDRIVSGRSQTGGRGHAGVCQYVRRLRRHLDATGEREVLDVRSLVCRRYDSDRGSAQREPLLVI